MPEKLIRTMDGEVITHFGVKGMRWGVRKKRGKGGRPTKEQQERAALRKRLGSTTKKDRDFTDQMIKEDSNRAAVTAGIIAVGATKATGGSWGDAAVTAAGAAATAKAVSTLAQYTMVAVIRRQEKKKKDG